MYVNEDWKCEALALTCGDQAFYICESMPQKERYVTETFYNALLPMGYLFVRTCGLYLLTLQDWDKF